MKRNHLKFGLLAVALFFCSLRATAQQEYVENGHFDVNIDGWTLETQQAGGMLSWAGALGSPSPGALRIQADSPGASSYGATTGCHSALPQSNWTLTAQAREEFGSNLTCSISIQAFDNETCSGLPTISTNDAGIAIGGQWMALSSAWTNDEPQILWVKAVLFLATGPGTKACNFDDVSLIGPATSSIPVLDQGGMVTLALILLVCGAGLLRRLD